MPAPTKLIFQPGAGGNPKFWKSVADRLTYSASRTLLGWPGFGTVPADPAIKSIDDLIASVVRQIDQSTALIAQSMGGVIAIQAALKRPTLVTHLVLTATSGGLDISDLRVDDWRPAFNAANQTLPRWFADYKSDLTHDLGALTMPTLLLWGDADPISPVTVGERLSTLLPNARLKVLAGGDHGLANTLAADVAPIIDAHLVQNA
jgi:pimeloyl-ACP methyl ester carboxylesterase